MSVQEKYFLNLGRYHLKTPFLYVFLDGVAILSSLLLISFLYPKEDHWQDQLQIGLLSVFLFYIFSSLNNLYSSWRSGLIFRETIRLWSSWFLTFFTLLAIAFATKTTNSYSRVVFVSWALVTPVVINFLHIYYSASRPTSFRASQKKVRAVLAGKDSREIKELFEINRRMGLDVEIYGYYADEAWQGSSDEVIRHLGSYHDLCEDARVGSFHLVYLNLGVNEGLKLSELTEELSNSTVSLYWMIPSELSPVAMPPQSHGFGNQFAMSLFESPFFGWQLQVKRIEDIIIGTIILMLVTIPMLLIALAIKLTSRGPVFFIQKRYGEGGKPFKMLKFRSMTVMENDETVRQATKGDKRLTKIGAFIRKTSIDELPQFINVLLGDMSIVGPRPHATVHNEQYRVMIKGYMLRHKVKPGITGLAQISGCRGITDTPEKMEARVKYDMEYIKKWSLWLDLKIILLTIFRGFTDPKAI